jgi:hypothetical protein
LERVLDRKSTSLCRLPHPAAGDQAAQVDIRSTPPVAQDLVARLESPSGKDLLFHRQGWRARLN